MKKNSLFILVLTLLNSLSAQVSSGINYEKQRYFKPSSASLIGINSSIKYPISMPKPLMALPVVGFDIHALGIFQYGWVPSMYNDKYQGLGL